MKKITLAFIILAVLLNACGNNLPPKPFVAEKITLGFNIPTPPESVQFIELVLKQDDNSIVKGANPEVFRKNILLSGNKLAVGTTRDLPVEINNVPLGKYEINLTAKSSVGGVELYHFARSIDVSKEDNVESAIVRGASEIASRRKRLSLERSVGDLAIRASKVGISGIPLYYTARVGMFSIPLKEVDGGLAGQLVAVPTGENQIALVEGRDSAGTLLVQGVDEIDLGVQPLSRQIQTTQVTQNDVPANIKLQASRTIPTFAEYPLGFAAMTGFNNTDRAIIQWGDGATSIFDPKLTQKQTHIFAVAEPQPVTVLIYSKTGVVNAYSNLVNVTGNSTTVPRFALTQINVTEVPPTVKELKLTLVPVGGRPITDGRLESPDLETIKVDLSRSESTGLWQGISRLATEVSYAVSLQSGLSNASVRTSKLSNIKARTAYQDFAFVYPKLRTALPQEYDSIKLYVSPNNALLQTYGEKTRLSVTAYNNQNEEVEVSQDIEWIVSDAKQVRILNYPVATDSIEVQSQVASGFAYVTARLRTQPQILAQPVSVTITGLKNDAVAVSDDAFVYPFPDIQTRDITKDYFSRDIQIDANTRAISIGAFQYQDLVAWLKIDSDNPYKSLVSAVLKDTTIREGQIIVPTGSSKIFGKVKKVRNQGNYSLIQVEMTGDLSVFQELKVSLDTQKLVQQGILSKRSVETKFSFEGSNTPITTYSKKGEPRKNQTTLFKNNDSIIPCTAAKPSVSKLFDKLKDGFSVVEFKNNLSLVGDFVARINFVNYNQQDVFAEYGWEELKAVVSGSLALRPNVKFAFECSPSKFLTIPIPMPTYIGAVFGVDLTVKPVLSGEIGVDLSIGPNVNWTMSKTIAAMISLNTNFQLGDRTKFEITDNPSETRINYLLPDKIFAIGGLFGSAGDKNVYYDASYRFGMKLGLKLQAGLKGKLCPWCDWVVSGLLGPVNEMIKAMNLLPGLNAPEIPLPKDTLAQEFLTLDIGPEFQFAHASLGELVRRYDIVRDNAAFDPVGDTHPQFTFRPFYGAISADVPFLSEIVKKLKTIPGLNGLPELNATIEGNFLFPESQIFARPLLADGLECVGTKLPTRGQPTCIDPKVTSGQNERSSSIALRRNIASLPYSIVRFNPDKPLGDIHVNENDLVTVQSWIAWEKPIVPIFGNLSKIFGGAQAPQTAYIPSKLLGIELFSKDWKDGSTALYKLPLIPSDKHTKVGIDGAKYYLPDQKITNRYDVELQPVGFQFSIPKAICDFAKQSEKGYAEIIAIGWYKPDASSAFIPAIPFSNHLGKYRIRCGIEKLVNTSGNTVRMLNRNVSINYETDCNDIGKAIIVARAPNVEFINISLDGGKPVTYYKVKSNKVDTLDYVAAKLDLKLIGPQTWKHTVQIAYPSTTKGVAGGGYIANQIDEHQIDFYYAGQGLCSDPSRLGLPEFPLVPYSHSIAAVRGDPHIGTFDGPRNSVHALGEFDYIRPKDPAFTEPRLQVRHELQRPGQPFAIATALALKYRGHIVEVRANKSPHLWIDGVAADYKFLELEKGFTIDVDPNTGAGKIFFGDSMIDFLNIGGAYNILARVPQKSPLVGLMGSPDGIAGNNRAGPDGVNVPGSPGDVVLGEAWRVPEAESQFTYDEGSYASYNKKNVYLKQLPTAEELAPFLEQARILLSGTCDSGTSGDAGVEEAALDLYAGMTQLQIMGHLCNYQVFGKVKNKNAPDVPFLGSVVKMVSAELGTCTIASDATGYFSCTMPPKPGSASAPKVTLELDGEQFQVSFSRRATPGEILSLQNDLEVSPTTLHLKGKVVDPEGQPVRLAKMQIRAPGQVRTVSTNENGLYDLYIAFVKSQADRDVLYDITVNSPGLRFAKRAGVRLIANGLREVTEDLQLSRSIKFSGQVLNGFLPRHTLGGVLTIRKADGQQLCKSKVLGHSMLRDLPYSQLNYVSTGENGASSNTYSANNQTFREYQYSSLPVGLPVPDGSYVCVADVNTLGSFDVDFEIKGDWGTSVTRVQVPAKLTGTTQEEEPFNQDIEASPAVLRITGKVVDNTNVPQKLFAGLLTDNSLLAADASFRMGLSSEGFEFVGVLKEGVTAGAVRLHSAGSNTSGSLYGWNEYLFTGANTTTVKDVNGNLRLGERTVEFTGVLKNALTNTVIPGEVIISSPQVGELCRGQVVWKTINDAKPQTVPDGTYTCTATIKQFADIDVIYQARGDWGDASNALRNMLLASKSSVQQDVVVSTPVVRVTGVVKNRLSNTVAGASVVVQNSSDNFDATFMTNGRNFTKSGTDGTYTLDLLLKAGHASGQFDVEASVDGVNAGYGAKTSVYTNASSTAKLPVSADIDISSGRVVKFIGQAKNGYLENAALRGRVVIKHVSGAEICATQVEISGQYSCTVVLESAAAFSVTHTLTGDWGVSSTPTMTVPEGKANTITQDIEGLPTTIEVKGRVRDTGDVQVSGGTVSLLGDTGFLSTVSTVEYQTGIRGEYRLVLVLKPNAPRARLDVFARYFQAEGKNLIDIQNVQSGQYQLLNVDLLVARPVQIAGVITNSYVPDMTLPGVIGAKLLDGSELCRALAGADGKFTCFGRVTTSGPVNVVFTVEGFWGSATQTAVIPTGHAYNISESRQDLSLAATTVKFTGKLIDTATNGAPYRGKLKISGIGTSPLELDADNITGIYTGYAVAPANSQVSVLWQARDTANNVAVKTLGVTATANVVTEVKADLRLETRTPGTARWANLTGAPFMAAPAISADGTLYYIGNANGVIRLHAIAIDGSPRWEMTLGNTILTDTKHTAPMVGVDGTIYVTHAGELIAVRPDASIRWRYVFDVNRRADGTLARTRDGIAVLSASSATDQANLLIMLNTSGVMQRSLELGMVGVGDLKVLPDNSLLVRVGQELQAYNPDGTKRWNVERNAAMAIGHNGELYLPSGTGLDVVSADLKPLWKSSFVASQVVIGDVGQVFAMNPNQVSSIRTDGSVRWQTTAANGVFFQTMTLGNDGLLYVAAIKNDQSGAPALGLVIAYQPDGTEAWRFSSPAPVREISMGVDGTVYAGGDKLYAINSTSTAPASGAWIQKYANISNHGVSTFSTDATRRIKVTGTLTNASVVGQPIENYTFQITRVNGTLFCNGVTDALGNYACEAPATLPATDLQLEFTGLYGDLIYPTTVAAGLDSAVTVVNQDLSIAVTTLELLGQALDNEQKPLANARVSITGQVTDILTTDAQGNFKGVYRFVPTNTRVTLAIEVSDGVAVITTPFEQVLTPKVLNRAAPKIILNRLALGMTRWRTTLPGDVIGAPVTHSNGKTYVSTTTAKLVEVNPDGQIGLTIDLTAPSSFSPTIATDGTIYLAIGSSVVAYAPNGIEKWRYTAATGITAPIALDHAQRLVIASRDAISVLETSGSLRWKFATTDAPIQIAVGGDETLYALNSFGMLRAVNASGFLRWTRDGVGQQFVIASTGFPVFMTAGQAEGVIVWLDRFGDVARSKSVAAASNAGLLALDDGRVIVTTNDQIVQIGSNDTLKTFNTPATGLAVGADDILYALHPNQIRAYLASGVEAWRTAGDAQIIPVPSVTQGLLLAVVGRNTLVAINTSSTGLANGWSRKGANQANSNRTKPQAAPLGRTLQLAGSLSNQFSAAEKLVGYSVEIRDTNNRLMCRTTTDLNGNYLCVTPVIPATVLEFKYTASKKWSAYEINESTLNATVASGTNGDITEITQNLVMPLTTVKLFGVVQDGNGQVIANAAVTIQTPNYPDVRVLTGADGTYSALMSFRQSIAAGQFTVIATNGLESTNRQIQIPMVAQQLVNQELNLTIGDRTEGSVRWTKSVNTLGGISPKILLDSADAVYIPGGVFNTAGLLQNGFSDNPMVISATGILDHNLSLRRPDGTVRWDLSRASAAAAPSNDGFHVISVQRDQYLHVSGNGVLGETTSFETNWKVLGSPLVHADGTAIVVVYQTQTGALQFHRFNSDGTPQLISQLQTSLFTNVNQITDGLLRQEPVLTASGNILMYTRTAAAAQLSQFSSTGDVVWNVQIAQTPNAVPVIAADGAITLALNNSLQVLEPSGAIRQNIAIQPMLASYTGLSILGVALGKDSTTMITVLANDKTALLAINAAGTKRWSYERQCGGIADTLASRSIRIALDGTVLTNLCSQVIAVTSSTLGLASTQWATVGRDNQNSSRIQGDGQNRRTIHIIGKLKNIYLPTHLFSNQKVVITDETNQVVCAVKSNLVGEYRCGFNTTNRNAMTWTAKTDDEYGFATQPFAVAAGEFNTRTEIEQDLLIPAKTLQLSGTLKLANGSLAIGKTVTFKLGASAPMETTSGNDGKYLFVTVFAKNQASITPELRFSDAGQDAVAKLLIELAPQGVTQATQDLQLGLQAGGSERWRVALNNNANMVLAPDGSLRVISQGVRAINLDGSLRWNVDNLSEGKLLVDHNGVTYVATNSQFIAYNPNGTIKYKVRNLPSSALGIAQTSDRGFVISYSNSYTIKVDANANEVWRYQLPTGSFTTSPITLADGNAVIGTDLGVMTISPTGALVSSLATPPVQRLIVNNSQVIASTGSTIRALQGTSQVWTFNANAANIQYLVADKDGIIYFSEANSIVALNQNGQLRWRKDIGTEVGSLAIGSDGIVHAITTNALLTLNPDSSIRWNTLISNQNLAIAPIIASDGTVFSTTLTQLLAHYTDSRGLDNSWARQGANNAGVNTLLSYTADNLPRTVKFRGLVSNQYIANSTLAGYTVSVKKADGKLLCRTQSDSTGMYECNSLLESDLTNVQYDIVGTLTSAQLTGVVPVGTLTIEQTKPLELPITTLKVEGVVEDIQQPAQPIANATVQIMLPTPTQSTLTNNNGSYGFYLAFADGTSQTQLQLSATFNANTVNKVINQNLTPHVLNTVNQKFVLDDRVIGAVARTVDLGAAQIGTPVIGGNNNIYVATTQGVRALRPDGGELWRYTIRIPSSQIRLLPDQSVVFSDGYRAIKLRADGSEDWVASGHSQVVAIGADQTIFTQATNGNIASLKPDGSLVWVSDVAGSANSVAITKDGTILSVNFLEVVALNPNGIRRWKKSINSYLYLPVISLSDSRIFIVNNDGNATMMALDYDGQFRWGTYQMDPGMKTSSAAIDQTGLVYFSQNGKLKIADQNGSIQAQVTVPDLQIKMPTIANDATVYALTNTGVVAVSSDQQIKWTYTGSGMPTSAIPVTGKSVLLSQGTKLLWINGNSTTLQPNAAWGHQSSDLAATRRLPSDGTQKRYAEFKGVINHAFIPSMKIANATVTVRANGVILCSANTSSTGVYRCAGPSDTLGSFTANIEVVSDYGVTSLSDTVAAAPVDTTTSIVNDIPINVSTVKLTGQIVDSAQNPVGNLNVRLLGIPANAIVSAEDGSAIARQWSSLDATYAHVVTANVGGQFNAWISLPVDVNATDFRVKVLNSDTGGVGNVGIQQAINQNQLNQINAVVTLQQTALKIRGQILKPNSQPYPNAKLSIMSPRPVQALDANGQPLGYNYRFDITTDSTGQYAITLNMVSEVTDPLEVTVEANITGNTVSRNVQATLLAGVTTEVIENITFDNAVIGVSSWNYDLDYSASRLAVGADRTVYATEKNFIHAINRDGSLKWKNEICAGCYGNNYYTLGTPVIRQDGVILVLAWRQYNQNASKLYAFNAAGTELWSYTLNSDTGTELALGSNSVVYVAVKNTNQVVAVGADGVELWRSKVEFASSYRSGKLLVAPDETIYFVSEDDAYYANAKIQAFNKNGTPRWQYPVNLALTGAAIATDGTLYVAGTQQLYSGPPSKKLLAITSSGKLRWEKDLFDSSNYHIIILPGEKVMVANVGLDNGTVFDNLGNTVQQITLDGYLVDNNGNVYGNISNSTKATSLANTTLWEFAKKGNGMVNGNLFVMRDQNQLYAVNIPTATLANTSWASVNKDQFNSSRSTPDAIVRRLVQIQGVVQTSPNNTPVSDAHVVIQFTNGDPFCNTTTDYDGNYTCAAPTDNFAAFDLQARVVQSSSGTGSQNVSVPTDAANSVTTLTSNLSVSRAQLRLQGIITDAAASPNPISGAVVSLRSNNVVNSNTTTDVNGVYSFLLDVNYATVEIEIQVHDQINTQKRVIIVSPPAGQLTERTENFQVDQTSTGTGRWAFNTNSGAELKTAAIAPSGEIYVGNDSGLLVSLTATGQERWRKTLQNVVSTPIISPSGTIYVSDSQNLYAFDNQGSQLWVESLGNDGVAQLAMMPSGAIITLTDHQIRKYSAIGQLQWTQPADYNYYAGNISPVITASNKILYCRNTLTMLNDDGSQAWQSSQNCASEIALSSTTAYVQNSGLVAVDLADGQTKWTYPTSSTTFTPLIDGQENITWVSRQGYLGYGYGSGEPPMITTVSASGTLLREATLPETNSVTGNMIYGTGSTLLVPRDGNVTALDQNLQPIWQYNYLQYGRVSGSNLTTQGLLLVGIQGKLLAINTGLTSILSTAPWAKAFGDMQNSGHN